MFHKESNAEHLRAVGAKYRFKPGHTPSKNRVMQKGESHYAWKGESVGYRGLHYWLRRIKGIPEVCIKCGSTRNVQWANTDGQYRRDPDDFVEMCASCHKKHDLAL